MENLNSTLNNFQFSIDGSIEGLANFMIGQNQVTGLEKVLKGLDADIKDLDKGVTTNSQAIIKLDESLVQTNSLLGNEEKEDDFSSPDNTVKKAIQVLKATFGEGISSSAGETVAAKIGNLTQSIQETQTNIDRVEDIFDELLWQPNSDKNGIVLKAFEEDSPDLEGLQNQAGQNSVSFGGYSRANGVSSLSGGYSVQLEKDNSIGLGLNLTSQYKNTYLLGEQLIAANEDQIIIGQYNKHIQPLINEKIIFELAGGNLQTGRRDFLLLTEEQLSGNYNNSIWIGAEKKDTPYLYRPGLTTAFSEAAADYELFLSSAPFLEWNKKEVDLASIGKSIFHSELSNPVWGVQIPVQFFQTSLLNTILVVEYQYYQNNTTLLKGTMGTQICCISNFYNSGEWDTCSQKLFETDGFNCVYYYYPNRGEEPISVITFGQSSGMDSPLTIPIIERVYPLFRQYHS